uniref:DNA excision repair protein ERCC-8 n=1 Tax=Schistocephalus solidus TaxID=70667 RepID=A0A0X3NWG3_SCHSO
MDEFWKCECNLSTYATFISRLRENAVAQLDVNYSINFDPSQRTSSLDIALDDVECRYLLSSSVDGSLLLFDTGNPIYGDNGKLTFPKLARIDTIPDSLFTNLRRSPHSGLSPSNCVQWNPVDSGFFITTSIDKTLKIWDTNRLECVDLIETAESMSWAALSPIAVEHNLIAVALTQSCDRQAILVDPIIGAPALSLRGGHTESHLSQIVWSMRSSFVVITAGHDGRILFWDIRLPSKPIDSLDNTSAPGYSSFSHDGELFCRQDHFHRI